MNLINDFFKGWHILCNMIITLIIIIIYIYIYIYNLIQLNVVKLDEINFLIYNLIYKLLRHFYKVITRTFLL